MSVIVPDVVGLDRPSVEAKLGANRLRYIAKFPFGHGDGSATEQNPAAGTAVQRYSIVYVSYATNQGPMDDAPIKGPFPSGLIEGTIDGVIVNETGTFDGMIVNEAGASITFVFTEGGTSKSSSVWRAKQ